MMTRTILLLVLGAFCFLFTLNLFLRGRSTETAGGILGLIIFVSSFGLLL
jgi:hypothetical protein